jgi:CPA2 family monovalent cation:H+ antiporter-2
VLAVDVVTLLAVAAGGLIAGRALGVPAIVTYLLAGVVAGPAVLGLVQRSPGLEQVAELGVALLLFGVGIEFSLAHLRRNLPRMLATGGVQIVATVAVAAAAFGVLGAAWPVAVFLGFLVTLSSTAIVFKLYDESGEIDAPHGRTAAGILLLQDLALVPMMLLVPVLTGPSDHILASAGLALVRALIALGMLLLVARLVLPRALDLVAHTRVPELFPIAAVVAAFGTALLAFRAGLSLPIGAFLAGLALSGSPYAHQAFAELLPLRDVFVALFFTLIGMLLDPREVLGAPALLLAMLAAVAVKGLLTGGIVHAVTRSREVAIPTALALSQIGEFSFVLAKQGVESGLITRAHEQSFLGAAILTMAATPWLVGVGRRLATVGAGDPSRIPTPAASDHVLVIGYGQTGQAVARVLRETGVPFEAVDLLADHIAAGAADGIRVHFGDASRRAVLETIGAPRARAAVVAVAAPGATRRIVTQLRQLNPGLRILVRVRRVEEIHELERLGANEVIPSEFEVSIELFVRLLRHLGVPRHVVRIQESVIRTEHYRALRGLGTTEEMEAAVRQLVAGGVLETARVMEGSHAAGLTLAELALRNRTRTVVLSVVRDGEPLPTPGSETRLLAGDLVVVFGPHEGIDQALALFESAAADDAATGA